MKIAESVIPIRNNVTTTTTPYLTVRFSSDGRVQRATAGNIQATRQRNRPRRPGRQQLLEW